MFKIDQATVTSNVAISGSGYLNADVTATVPTGAKVIAGGWSVYNTTQSIYVDGSPSFDAPLSDGTGWRVYVRTVAPAVSGDEIQVKVYATYVQID